MEMRIEKLKFIEGDAEYETQSAQREELIKNIGERRDEMGELKTQLYAMLSKAKEVYANSTKEEPVNHGGGLGNHGEESISEREVHQWRCAGARIRYLHPPQASTDEWDDS